MLVSPGPDLKVVIPNRHYVEINELLYDPTNGTISDGMVIYSSRRSYNARTTN